MGTPGKFIPRAIITRDETHRPGPGGRDIWTKPGLAEGKHRFIEATPATKHLTIEAVEFTLDRLDHRFNHKHPGVVFIVAGYDCPRGRRGTGAGDRLVNGHVI